MFLANKKHNKDGDLLINTETLMTGCYVSSLTHDHRDVRPTASHGTCKGRALVRHQLWQGWQQLSLL